MKKTLVAIVLLACFLAAFYAHAAQVPYLTGRITDNAGILSPEARERIGARLKAHEDKTTNQIAVLTVETLDGASIEDYAFEVLNTWKLGRKGQDNGLLIVVAPSEHRVRIEVGYGLEGYLNDSLAGGIIRNTLTPYFKKGDYETGLEAGMKEIIFLLEGGLASDTDAPYKSASKRKSGGFLEQPDMSLTERILIGAFIFTIIGLFTVIGVITPGVGWFLYFFLIPFWAMFPVVVVGATGALYLLIAYLVLFPLVKLYLKSSGWTDKAREDLKTKGHMSVGPFTITPGTSGRSGSSWSSGRSGGGFSGGGGRSGGGGTSGSW